MYRSALKIICIVSGILFVIFGIFVAFSVAQFFDMAKNNASIGIIGGADAPTIMFWLQKVARSPVFCAGIVTLCVFIGTGLGLIFSKK